MNTGQERRSETRLEENTTIYVEVCSASFDNSSPANVLICNSLDISANGILVEMDQPVEVGTILRICADFAADEEQSLYLVGEVKWVRPAGEAYNIGFELYEAEDTDISGWKQVIAKLLSQSS